MATRNQPIRRGSVIVERAKRPFLARRRFFGGAHHCARERRCILGCEFPSVRWPSSIRRQRSRAAFAGPGGSRVEIECAPGSGPRHVFVASVHGDEHPALSELVSLKFYEAYPPAVRCLDPKHRKRGSPPPKRKPYTSREEELVRSRPTFQRVGAPAAPVMTPHSALSRVGRTCRLSNPDSEAT